MSYVTVPNRPLLSVGTWNASTGEEVISEDDLRAVVAASQSGVLDSPVIKLGHQDPARNDFADGEPAYGQVTNLRVVGDTLYGDYINMPSELAESMSSAYPAVSVELARNVKLRNAQGEVAHSFDVVLTAAALLGATAPAVKGLSQKVYAFREAVGEDAFDYTTALPTSFAEKRSKKTAEKPAEEPAEKPAEQEAPAEKPAQEQEAPAEEPAQPAEEAEQPRESGDTPDVPPQEPESAHAAPEAPAPAPHSEPEGAPPMPNIDEQAAALRKKYDLPENASYKDLLSKVLDEKIVAGVNQEPVADVRPGSDETPHEEVTQQIAEETQERQKHNLSESAQDEEQVNVTAPAPTSKLDDVYVSKSAFSQLMEEFNETKAELAARKSAEVKAHRDQLVSSWFRAGIIAKDEREVVREELDKSESTVVALMERRTPIYPTAELGHAVNDPAHFALDTDETKTEKLYEADDAIFGA